MELHQDLADHAHAGLGALAGQRQGVEVVDNRIAGLLEPAAGLAFPHLLLAGVHPVAEEGVGAAGLDLVGAGAVERGHEHVAVGQSVDGLLQHGQGDLEARIALVEVVLQGERDHGDMGEPRGLQGLADQADVVGRAAAATRLRDEHGQVVGVVAARKHRFHDLARDEDRRVADVVVHEAQARVDGLMVDRRQQLEVVAVGQEDGLEQLEVDRGHLRGEDRVAGVLHLLGEFHALEFGRAAFALHELVAVDHGGVGAAQVGGVVDAVGGDLLGHGGRSLGLGFARLGRSTGLEILHELVGGQIAHRAAPFGGRLLGFLVLLFFEGGEQAAHADAGRTQVRYLVDLQHRVDLARGFQDLLHLVGREGVEAAAEAVELDEVEVAALGDDLGGVVEAGVVHPLVDQADGALEFAQVGNRVFGEHGQAEAREQLGDRVVDFGVVVVGTAGEHDAMGARLFHPGEGFLALHVDVVLEAQVLFPGRVDGLVDLAAAGRLGVAAHKFAVRLHELDIEALLQLVLLVVGQVGVEEFDVGAVELVDVQAQGFRIAHDDRAVVVVARALVFAALPLGAGHPDEVGVLGEQVHDVAMAHLGGIAHVFRRDRLDARFEGLLGRRVGQLDAEAELGEEGEPEGVVFVHVERTGHAHGAAGRLVLGERLVVEQAVALPLEEVGHLLLVLGHGAQALFAAIARDEAAVLAGGLVLAEVVDGEQAMVVAGLAAQGLVGGIQGVELVGREEGRDDRGLVAARAGDGLLVAVARQKAGAVGAHVARDVGAHRMHAGKLFEGAQDGVV